MRGVEGKAKTVKELLKGSKYSIDDYQREYKWETKHVTDLLDDLSNLFLDDFREDHDRQQVAEYGRYFLGSIIISRKDGRNFIVDGQQRLTTLTLLLLHLRELQKGLDGVPNVDDLIYSERYSKKSFNLEVPEREAAMRALFDGDPVDDASQPESVQNILARHRDIQEYFPDLNDKALPFFTDWLTDNVYLVEITAYSDDDAYTIFETINDRGLSLSPSDMLKGYLVSSIQDQEGRKQANLKWKSISESLLELDKEAVTDCLKSWLRSQYARKIRERKRDAIPQDFDRIGTEFHRWVRENRKLLGLNKSSDFERLIHRDVRFYASRFKELRQASTNPEAGHEEVFYNGQLGFTLQFPVLLAPLKPEDSEEVIRDKVRLVSTYLSILLTRRIWNWRSIAYSTMQYAMFLAMRDIRDLEPKELAEELRRRLDAEEETFATNDSLSVHTQNRSKLHLILARMIDFLERKSGQRSRFEEYVSGWGKTRYEVEHIWADKYDRHKAEFSHPRDFQEYRNRIGGLLLLPGTFNKSYGALPYKDKLKHYDSQNLLARSLNPNCYDRNPGFKRFVRETGLPFEPYPEFNRSELDARQQLYMRLAERIWDPDQLKPTSA